MIEYWTGPRSDYKFPINVHFDSKMDTDLYEFVKVGCFVSYFVLTNLSEWFQNKITL
jgi:hypothetical protein